MIERIEIGARGPGLHEFTPEVERVVTRAGLREGLCTLFVQHTSASLLIQENADPSARRDLERWIARLEDTGFVTSAWEDHRLARDAQRPPRKYYEITAKGEDALAAAGARYRLLEGPAARKGLRPAKA